MKKKIPQIKKNIRGFLLSEEGNIEKKKLLKMGMSLATISLFMAMYVKDAAAGHHSYLYNTDTTGAHYSSHDAGGWC